MAPNDHGEGPLSDKASSLEWTEGELDAWFDKDFGGDLWPLIMGTHPATSELGDGDLLLEYLKELLGENLPSTRKEGVLGVGPWGWMDHDAKERFRRVWEEQYLGAESAIDDLTPIVVDMPGPGALPKVGVGLPTDDSQPDDEGSGQVDQELGGGLMLPEGWEDLEPMEDPTVREAITDRIESTDEPVEADLPGLLDDEGLRELDKATSEIPLYELPDPEPVRDVPQIPPKRSPRKVLLGLLGGFGIVGVIVVGLLLFASSDSAPSSNTVAAAQDVEESASPAEARPLPTEALASDQPSPTGPAAADVSSAAFPGLWLFTATKTASIVPAPDFIGATPVGTVLPWSVAVTESCSGEACTYTSVIQPLIPESVLEEVPEAIWVLEGAEWSLDVTWLSTQSFFGDGTVCVIETHWTYQFTVTEAELIEGRSIATAFDGTWLQEDTLNLSVSTGDLSLCGESWTLFDEWTVIGSAAG